MRSQATDLPRLLAEEPFVRALARRLLADEPDDIVQQTFLQALQHRPIPLARPRAWLTRVVANLVHNQRREQRRREARERRAAVAEQLPSTVELTELDERRSALMTAVNQLPADLRTLVLLRYYEGLPPRRIAAAMDLPVAVVWERLRQALELLRRRLDQAHGSRRVWLLPLVALSVRPRPLPWRELLAPVATTSIGVLAMTTKTKFAIALALAMAALYLLWPTMATPPGPTVPRGPSPTAATAVAAVPDAVAVRGTPSEPTQREAVAMPGAPDRGDLVVRLRYGDDHSPAAGVMLTAFRKNEIPKNSSAPSVDAKRRRTDADGVARFPSMRAGRTGLIADRGHWFENAHVEAGKSNEIEWVMPVGVTITGIVVSAIGAPVGGADVELESSAVATTDAQGRFSVRGASPHYAIGARALGHGASKAQQLMPHDGRAEVRLELGAEGGIVEGVALDPDCRPLANVRVDIGRYEGGSSWVGDAPPRPAHPRTDAEGRFSAISIPPGEQQVRARASGFVPWSGKCRVTAGGTAELQITFAHGNTLRGTLRDADGNPFGDVLVGARAGELDWDEVVDPEGHFTIAGLPDGEVDVTVNAEGQGKAHARVQLAPGGTLTTCELTLERGIVVKGHVRDEAGQPLPKVSVRLQPSSLGEGYAFTDENGAFTIANAPAGKLTVMLDGDAIKNARFDDIDPRTGELDLRAERRAAKTVYIAGTVLDPDGRPAVARAWASGGGSSDIEERNTDAAGYFELGPVASGHWKLVVESRLFPRVTFARRDIAANSRWEVGTVQLAAGGGVRVEVVEGDTEGVWLSIRNDEQRGFSLQAPHGKGTSELLPVGNYRLFVAGKTLAAQAIPFEIRAGETTKVEVRVRAGVRQRFEIARPANAERNSGSLRVLRGADFVQHTWASWKDEGPCIGEACLAPGDYTVTATFGALEGSASFTVGEREGEPVRITIPGG